MGGRVLEYEAKTILNEGIRQGLSQGKSEGMFSTLFKLVKSGLLSVSDAASSASVSEAVFREKMAAYSA